jgi:hypothetical protein
MNTEIVQRVSSIATCDVKDLTQVLSEALEKVLHFESLCSKLARAEGVPQFYKYENPVLLKKYGQDNKQLPEIAQQKFMEVAGGTTFAELDIEVDKRLGQPSFWGNVFSGIMSKHPGAYGGKKSRLHSPANMKIFLDSFDKEATELKPIVNRAAIEMEQSALMLVPPDYRYPLALTTMLGFVRNLKATTWKECANLYDEQVYRWQMLENSAENIRIQNEIRGLTKRAADSATAAAVFSGLNLLLK